MVLVHRFPLGLGPLESRRRLVPKLRAVHLRANHRVRANHHALAALDAQVLVPNWNELRNVPLLPLRSARWKCSTGRNRTHRQLVSVTRCNLPQHIPHKLRRLAADRWNQIKLGRRNRRQLHFFQVSQRCIHGGKVLFDHRVAAFAVGFLDGFLDLGNVFFAREHAADREETRLHDGIDARAHTRIARYRVAVDHVELNLLGQHLLLRGFGQMVPDLGRRVGRVEQKHSARHGCFHHVHLLQEAEVVTGHKTGARNQVA